MKVFITADGKFYKAETAGTIHCAEMNFPDDATIEVLTETPISREELNEKLKQLAVEKFNGNQ